MLQTQTYTQSVVMLPETSLHSNIKSLLSNVEVSKVTCICIHIIIFVTYVCKIRKLYRYKRATCINNKQFLFELLVEKLTKNTYIYI